MNYGNNDKELVLLDTLGIKILGIDKGLKYYDWSDIRWADENSEEHGGSGIST